MSRAINLYSPTLISGGNTVRSIALQSSIKFTTLSVLSISEDKTAVLLKAESSIEPNKKYTIPIEEVHITELRQHDIFEPHIQINVTGSLDTSPIQGDFTAGLSTPLFHLIDKRLDMLAPKISFGEDSFRVGADIVSYNIGHDLPIITDTWISLGVSWNVLDGNPSPGIDLSLGSKF